VVVAQVLQEAVQRNDEYKVYCQMAAIYANSNKTEDAEKIYKILLKKFPKEKDVWIRYQEIRQNYSFSSLLNTHSSCSVVFFSL
jgi:hypothetical protein